MPQNVGKSCAKWLIRMIILLIRMIILTVYFMPANNYRKDKLLLNSYFLALVWVWEMALFFLNRDFQI